MAGVEISRTIQGDTAGDVVTYARVDLKVERFLSGDAPAMVPLEFLVGATPELARIEVDNLREFVPAEASVFFLHEKQGEFESGLYRVTSPTGLWSSTARAELDTPLLEESPSSSGLYAAEVRGIETLAELADRLAAYA